MNNWIKRQLKSAPALTPGQRQKIQQILNA
jgi:hypothetical protein